MFLYINQFNTMNMKHLNLCLLFTLLAFLPLCAQHGDLLQKKAKEAEKYASSSEVVLMDSTSVTVKTTGSGTFIIYKALLVNNMSGALANRIIRYDYDPLTAFAEFGYARIYKADGEVINLDVKKTQDYAAPARAIYWGARQIMLEVGKLEPGDIVEIQIKSIKKVLRMPYWQAPMMTNALFLLCVDSFTTLFHFGVLNLHCAKCIKYPFLWKERCNFSSTKASVPLLCAMSKDVRYIVFQKQI